MTGEIPDVIDHIDGDPTNNAWANLRPATYETNGQNSKVSKNNKSGLKGASFHKATGRWRAGIGVNGKKIHLGVFDTAEEAHRAYVAAAEKLYGEFARAA